MIGEWRVTGYALLSCLGIVDKRSKDDYELYAFLETKNFTSREMFPLILITNIM